MLWSINTQSTGARLLQLWSLAIVTSCIFSRCSAQIASIEANSTAVAGKDFSISTAGKGEGLLYITGPGDASKQKIELGENVLIPGSSLSFAGMYLVSVCSETCQSTQFYVEPGPVASLSLLAHPSRVPVRAEHAISEVVFAFDAFHNLVLAPVTITLTEAADGLSSVARSMPTSHGVAWLTKSSSGTAGSVQLAASYGAISVRRIVQQVAADACDLRIIAKRTPAGVLLETAPVRDCAGNLVPDGTIVTFTNSKGTVKSTIDVPVKKGIARVEMPTSGGSISAASGVVIGNSIHVSP